MSPKPTILVIDDEPYIVLGIKDALEFEGYKVISATRGKEGLAAAERSHPDAVLLDLMLPDMNGFTVCEELRRIKPHLPILMITARSQEGDKLRGFNVGADDYVTKPFSLNELIARIRAILRRTAKRELTQPSIVIGEATVHLATHMVEVKGVSSELSYYEVELIRYLFDRVGEPVHRDEILDRIWGLEPLSTNRTVDNFIVKLRKKIEPVPDKPRHILTVYGFGYKLAL